VRVSNLLSNEDCPIAKMARNDMNDGMF